jgi:16S rRNA (cytosine1402-N4)-methyltransferase
MRRIIRRWFHHRSMDCASRRPKLAMITLAPTASFLSYPCLLFTSSSVAFPPAVHGFQLFQHPQQQRDSIYMKCQLVSTTATAITTRFYSTSIRTSQEESLPPPDDSNTISQCTPFSTSYHSPVMVKECIDALLDCQRARLNREASQSNNQSYVYGPLLFVDGTLGGGGHSAALLESLGPQDIVLGCDVDPMALQTATMRLSHYMNHNGQERPLFIPVECNFADLTSVLPAVLHPITQQPILEHPTNNNNKNTSGSHGGVDGILLDFGVSSYQIDEPTRGFSFMRDGPLDMRMAGVSTHQYGLTAADVCNEFDEQELQRIFSKYGDEPRAKTLAQAVVKHRPMTSTGDLVKAIASVTPAFAKNKRKGQTATCARIFQSLRIVVNNEDGVLARVLSEVCPTLLCTGGRLVCMSYHSMEDRATKRIIRDGRLDQNKRAWEDEKDMYGNYLGPPKPFRPSGKPIKASAEEVERNPRARSAVLRVGERL